MGVMTKSPVTPAVVPTSRVVQTIVNATVETCREIFGQQLTHIILTGSMARNEHTALGTSEGWKVLGDAEFLLVFHRGVPLPAQEDIDALNQSISELCTSHTVFCAIHLAAVHPAYLRRLPRHIFSYELKAKGRVVHGNPEILHLIPAFSREMVEREDAWRMLSNRMIEWLENLAKVPDGQAEPGLDLLYSSVKLCLDAATSLLVFLGGYEPTYCGRAERLKTLADEGRCDLGLPLPLAEFAVQVAAATRWKLLPDLAMAKLGRWSFCMAVCDYASRLWSWELVQMASLDPSHSPLELIEEWGQSLRFARRWRGWLRAAREVGWGRSLFHWPRWCALARRGTPRHWTYGTMAECALRKDIFSPNQAPAAASGLVLSTLRPFLPVVWPNGNGGRDDWRALVRDLAWNYHEFVERTRA